MTTFDPRWLAVVALAFAPLALAQEAPRRLPAEAQAILDKADSITLLSLDPEVDRGKKGEAQGFHGWHVLGQTTVTKGDRKKLLDALAKGIADKDARPAKCFEPRHGIAASVGGKSVELVICFECSNVRGHLGKKVFGLAISEKSKPAFDAILKAAKVPLPK